MRPNVRFRLIGRVNTWFELISLNHPEPRLLKSQVSRPPQPAKNDIMFIAIILSSFILVNSICLLGVFLPSKTMVRLFPSAPLSGPMRRLPPCSCSFLWCSCTLREAISISLEMDSAVAFGFFQIILTIFARVVDIFSTMLSVMFPAMFPTISPPTLPPVCWYSSVRFSPQP